MYLPSYMEQQPDMDLSQTILMENNDNTKENFRFSVASTSTNTTTTSNSTQRLSLASLSEKDYTFPDCHQPNTMTISSIDINKPSENRKSLKTKIIHKFHAKSRQSISEYEIMQNGISIDPWCISARYAFENAICYDLVSKYESPTFSFTKLWKKRYIVLVDRIVYVFKGQNPTQPARDHFILTSDTLAFVTEEFKKGYVIELRKPDIKWNIRCSSTDQIKTWLDAMKKIIACIKVGYDGLLSSELLSKLTLTDDYRILVTSASKQGTRAPVRHSLPIITTENNNRPVTICRKQSTNIMSTSNSLVARRLSTQRQSFSEIPDWKTLIPPQLPPPRTRPPPIPLPTVSE